MVSTDTLLGSAATQAGILGRTEFHNKTMTKMFGSPLRGTYVLAVIIFSLGIIRDLMYVSTTRFIISDSPSDVDLMLVTASSKLLQSNQNPSPLASLLLNTSVSPSSWLD